MMTPAQADAFESWLLMWFGLVLEDVEVCPDAPGCWRARRLCGGRATCDDDIHHYDDRPMCHVYRYADPDRDGRGRFASPHATWNAAVSAAENKETK